MTDSPKRSSRGHEPGTPQKKAAIQITDMVNYSSRTYSMAPAEIRDFIIGYNRQLREIVLDDKHGAQDYYPLAGDSSVALFTDTGNGSDLYKRALKTAVRVGMAVESGKLIDTRLGVYAGDIIVADFENQSLSFGNSFSAAARLEQLCGFFGTHLLLDRDIARAADDEQRYVVSIGKVTPKNFHHPIHIFTVYRPGLHNCPRDIDEQGLAEFVRTKNEAMAFFTGNALLNIPCNFALARNKLSEALQIFLELTGCHDLPTQRILDYIAENPFPGPEFGRYGMRIGGTGSDDYRPGRISRLSGKLLKALDQEFYRALVDETEWEHYFKLEWHQKGTRVINAGEEPDGVYYIESGEVVIRGVDGNILAMLSEGDIFGEMAYFSGPGRRNADVVGATDLVVRKISGDDLKKFPQIENILAAIARKRQETRS